MIARTVIAAALGLVVSGCGDAAVSPESTQTNPAGYDVAVVEAGKIAYEETCAACHGVDLQGTETGPPFLSPIYAPNHHPDEAFFAAVENGVQPHHWDFGPMPPQPSVSREEAEAIVAYVRTVQVENGITHDSGH